MKQKLIRFITLCLSLILLVSLAGCGGLSEEEKQARLDRAKYGEWYKKSNTVPDQSYLYGMCVLPHEHTSDSPAFPWDIATELCNNLGVKSIRTWLHFQYVMDTKMTLRPDAVKLYHEEFARQKQYGMQIFAMCHSSLQPGRTYFSTSKPRRNLSEGSEYMQWLEDYENCWYIMAKEFPEVEYWEIDNESNIDVFMPPFDGKTPFSLLEKARIFTDMLFFASRGIHRGNPNANTVMGGIVGGENIQFLNYIYDLIYAEDSWSPYPDDYFQCAAWHPYEHQLSLNNINSWVETQQKTYAVIKEREGKDKKVFFTEFGWADLRTAENLKSFGVMAVYSRIKKDLPFVEAAHYFRMFDRLGHTWGSEAEKTFGLFNDAITMHKTDSSYVLGAPKNFAYIYQENAGGTGDLTILQKWAENRG